MSSNLGTLIKESDGTLTDGELVFQPLEFSNKEDFLADKQKNTKILPKLMHLRTKLKLLILQKISLTEISLLT